MIYLSTFNLPSPEQEENFFFGFNPKNARTCYTTKYPFGLFRYRDMPDEFAFDDITIFCGNNGSGKSTILNVIAEKLELKRNSPFNRSDFFGDYVDLCDYQLDKTFSLNSSVITSDDVFDRVLDIRRVNDGIDNKREDLLREWLDSNGDGVDTAIHGLDDYERWKRISDARNKNKSQSSFIRSRLVRNIQERSNGESSLSLFVDAILDDGIYLLDEPENSLSAAFQQELAAFLADSARFFGCQLVIATHSPFLLSIPGAVIYDLDSLPVQVRPWTELENVRVYYEFFKSHQKAFEP